MDQFAAVVLLGPRQTGKTTLAFAQKQNRPNALYLDGQISGMYLPELNHYALWAWRSLVSIIGLVRPAGE